MFTSKTSLASGLRPHAARHRKFTTARLLGALLLLLASASPLLAAAEEDELGSSNAGLNAPAAPSRGTANVSPEVAQKAAAISRQTMSPFCPGRTLSDCPSEYATQWRKDIRAMVAQGMSASEIQKELESRVGENLSGSPNRSAGYGVSLGLALGAALVLFFVLSRLRHNSRKVAPAAAAAEPDAAQAQAAPLVDDARLERELALAEGDDD